MSLFPLIYKNWLLIRRSPCGFICSTVICISLTIVIFAISTLRSDIRLKLTYNNSRDKSQDILFSISTQSFSQDRINLTHMNLAFRAVIPINNTKVERSDLLTELAKNIYPPFYSLRNINSRDNMWPMNYSEMLVVENLSENDTDFASLWKTMFYILDSD